MKVLVTGANGHIGAHVVEQLIQQGHQVRAMVRRSSDTRGIDPFAPELVYGDIMSAQAVEDAASGCEAIIHMAAVYKTMAETPEEIVQPAVQGAENVFRAAAKHGIGRVVYTSSVASIGFTYDPDQYLTNADWNEDAQNPYYVAKTQSERRAQAMAAEYGIHLVVLCPSVVLGPRDYRITPSNALVRDMLNGKGQTYPGGLNIVDVRDVAAAHVAALTRGESGHRYIIGGENLEVRKLGEKLHALTGIRPVHLPFGRTATLTLARAVEKICKLIRVRPPFTYDLVYEAVGRYCYFDTGQTTQALGITGRPADATLRDTIRWLLEQDQLKPAARKRLQSAGF